MLEKGDKIEDYTLITFLGKGQFGEVWLAEKQLKFSNRKFRHALKFLSDLGDEINLKSAEAEIDTWIEVSGHPNVMSVFDMLMHKEHIIIASEYAEGGSLKGWLDKSGGKAPSQEEALEMMLGIMRGIEHLHSRNVVHRDLKPDNILLQGNFPRLTDFGISRIVSTGSMSTKAIGSPAYMSPEALDGSKSPQADIWSAGVILFEMLTGGYPFNSNNVFGLFAAIQRDEPRRLPEYIPNEIRQIVDTALQKNLAKRFQTAEEMRSAIEHESYNLKGRSKTQAAVTERLLDVLGHIDPLSITEAIDENIEKVAIQTTPADVVDEPDNPSVENVVLKTQPLIIDSTQDAEELRKKLQIERENEIARIEKQIKEREDERPSPGKRVALIAGLAGSGILGILVIFLIVTFSFKPDGPAGNPPTVARNSESGPATNESTTTQPRKTPEAPAEMVYVDGGEFTMGRDLGKIPDEMPAHIASVGPFFMDIFEVTNEKYAEFIKATDHAVPAGWKNNTYPNGTAKFPVVGVNWNDASEYAKWAGKRLPTEEEWEFAARGKDSLLYPWGNDWKPGNANAVGASRTFAEVGKFKGASPFGIYDMVGNAGEWTANDFKAYSNGRISEVYRGKSNLKTIRGNSFDATIDFANTTYRIGWAATGASDYKTTGFRCAKDVGN